MWCWAFLMSRFIKCYACKHNARCTSRLKLISSAVCMMVKKYQYVCSYLSWSIVNCKSFHSFLNEIYLLWLVVKILFFLLYFIATFFYCLQCLLWGIFLISRLLYLSYFYIYLSSRNVRAKRDQLLILQMRKWGPERSNNLHKVTQWQGPASVSGLLPLGPVFFHVKHYIYRRPRSGIYFYDTWISQVSQCTDTYAWRKNAQEFLSS